MPAVAPMSQTPGKAAVAAAPAVRFDRFAAVLEERLTRDGFIPVAERFPLAAQELGLLAFRAVVRPLAARSYVVALTRGDGMASEQLRYLSDQYYNALVRETNELKLRPTLLRGICIFGYERTPDPAVVGFLMQRVRPRTPFTAIRSLPWVLDLVTGDVQRPALTRAPFPLALLEECRAAARS